MTSSPSPDKPSILLIAPNVSDQMGGEAIKALQIFDSLESLGYEVEQITHARVRDELEQRLPGRRIHYIEDDWLQVACHKSRVFSGAVTLIFNYRAARLADKVLAGRDGWIAHYTAPVSPVKPRFRMKQAPYIVGPLNGNIFHPPAFRDRRSLSDRVREMFHPLLQKLHAMTFRGNQHAELILVSGGDRSFASLKMAGCKPQRLVPSIDSGIPNRLADLPRIQHQGDNLRFVHNGRLVPHKGGDLAIRALARTRHPVTLDVIGRGPAEEQMRQAAAEAGVTDRVNFLGWVKRHEDLPEALRAYRAFVFPSLAEANGIVVQEAMMMGLPVICADWGGPTLLVTDACGRRVPVDSKDALLDGLAHAMDELATDGDLADRMSIAGRERALAEGYAWRDAIQTWTPRYDEVARRRSTPQGQAAPAVQ